MNILGISCYYHDAAAALLQDGMLVAAAEEERFTRRKHDASFPRHAIRFCLQQAQLSGRDLDYVVFYEKPLLKLERIWRVSADSFPRSVPAFTASVRQWLFDRLWVKSHIASATGVSADRILFAEHHLSHAASTFFASGFDEAAILTADGVGEWATATIGIGRNTTIRVLEEIRFPHSLGLLYSAFTAFLGFEVNEGEYKVMGLAPFGSPKYVDRVYKLVTVADDGSFELNLNYFSHHWSADQAFSEKLVQLFGTPRAPKSHFFTQATGYYSYFGAPPPNYQEEAERNQYYADVAASIQQVTEEILLKMSCYAYSRTGLKRLCLAGGVALNSVANGRILRETPFEEIYIQPAAGDGGGALGAALYGYHAVLGKPRRFVMDHAHWGQEYHHDEIKCVLDRQQVAYRVVADDEQLMAEVAQRLAAGQVVGWFQGRFEWGPRALGNRSILADPRRADMKDIVNVKIKFREPFRPFAPSVLVENAEDYFCLPGAAMHYPARFMLYVTPVHEQLRNPIPAVTHVDGTARLQTVHREVSDRYYRLIAAFCRETGVPVVLNTSFNLKGEPIVNSPQDALATFASSGMDTLVLENYVVEK